MRRNFFQIILKHPHISNSYDARGLEPLFAYIQKYWKKTRSDLAQSDFDIEECFTMLEMQSRDAIKLDDKDELKRLFSIEFSLKCLLAEVLSEF